MRTVSISIVALLLTGCGGCRPDPEACSTEDAEPGATQRCALDGWEDRGYDVYLPDGYDAGEPAPLILALHGGGGDREAAVSIACPEGDLDSPECLHNLANERGYVVVAPAGTGAKLLPDVRTWNAGGGEDGWQCVSGVACKDGVDDIAYFGDLLEDLDGWLNVDRERVHATGLSNGGAMSHRLACDMADEFASVAPVASANQVETVQGCDPAEPVAILDIHGTEDPCWPYDGGAVACAQKDGGEKNSVDDSMASWADRNGCEEEPETEELPDESDDGTSAERLVWQNCDADVVHIRIEGSGHTWPNGNAYRPERRVGKVTRDFGSPAILDFFDNHHR